jgi:hypothetical protein
MTAQTACFYVLFSCEQKLLAVFRGADARIGSLFFVLLVTKTIRKIHYKPACRIGAHLS